MGTLQDILYESVNPTTAVLYEVEHLLGPALWPEGLASSSELPQLSQLVQDYWRWHFFAAMVWYVNNRQKPSCVTS